MSNHLELRHFRYFLAVAEKLHFRQAAEQLYISQPGLSRQIKQMEEDLGIQLFERHNRSVLLTPAGKYLQKELQEHFKQLDGILDHARLVAEGLEGNLNLGYVGSAIQGVIPDLLLKFKESHPRVLFSLKEMDNRKQIEALQKREIDLGFVRMERVPHGLTIQPVFEDTFSLVLPKNHFIDESNFVDLAQLKDEPFIFFDASYSESYYEKVMQIFDQSHFTPIVSHYTVNANSIFRLVENELGISIVPTALKFGYDMGIKFIELNKIPQRTTLRAVWNSGSSNPVLEKFIHLL